MKLLSRAIASWICLCLCVCLLGCEYNDRSNAPSYDEEYYEGYEAGLWDGAFECKQAFADTVRDRYSDIEGAASNGREFHAEEAIMILNDYLDGEYVSDYELEAAIESITDFYYDWTSVIANIDDLDVDIYFDDKYIPLD